MSPINFFVSYCRADSSEKDALLKCLAVMIGEGLVEIWHDRKVAVGSELNKTINAHLKKSDALLFLASRDSLASVACRSELSQAKELELDIIPIILGKCDWKNAGLSDILAAPKDGKPVRNWERADDAWQDVVQSLRQYCDNCRNEANKSLLSNFAQELNASVIELIHPEIDKVGLDQIFVYPLLECLQETQSELRYLTSQSLCGFQDLNNNHFLLVGPEQIGKTALCKMLYRHYYENGMFPLWVNGKDVSNDNFDSIQKIALRNQYSSLSLSEMRGLAPTSKVLILDDFDDVHISKREWRNLIKCIQEEYNYVIVSASEDFLITEYSDKENWKYNDFDRFLQLRIRVWGKKLRNSIVEKWISLSVKNASANELFAKHDRICSFIDSTLGKGILPSYPFHILAILQVFEGLISSDHHLTSQADCYQMLVDMLLVRARVSADDIGTYNNFTSQLAYRVFSSGKQYIPMLDYDAFLLEYQNKYNLSISKDTLFSTLFNAGILQIHDGCVRFKYEYLYYFFVGKFFAGELYNVDIMKEVATLCRKMHIRQYANILIFICHQTNNLQVVDEIMKSSQLLLEGSPVAKLQAPSTAHLSQLILDVPDIVVPSNNDPKAERLKRAEAEEAAEPYVAAYDSEIGHADADSNPALIYKALKSLEVIGQILKNRQGVMEKEKLIVLFTTAQELGLRLLSHLLGHFNNKRELVDFVMEALKNSEEFSDESATVQRRFAKFLVSNLLYWCSFGLLKKIAFDIGSDKLINVAIAAQPVPSTPASDLISICIQLWTSKHLDVKAVESLAKKFEGNLYAHRLLKDIVIDHILMHDISYKDNQRLSVILNIPTKVQANIKRIMKRND